MADQQPDALHTTKDVTLHPADSPLTQDVQHRFANWVTNGADQHGLANAHEATLPLPVMLLHLYRDLLHFYERRLGMSQSRVLLLHEVMHAGEISQIELAQRLGIEAALLTRFAKQMEASGLLSRRVDPHDNRYTLVTLTQTGQNVFQRMMVFSREFEAQLVEGLSGDERAGIRQALMHIQERFSSIQGLGNGADQASGDTPVSPRGKR